MKIKDTRKHKKLTIMLKCLILYFAFVFIFLNLLSIVQPKWKVSDGNKDDGRRNSVVDLDIELDSVKNEILLMAEELEYVKTKKEDLQKAKLKEDDLGNAPANELIRKSQVAGDYVHYTRDRLLCGQETLKLLIVVNTKYQEWRERDMIRNTWGKQTNLVNLTENGQHKLRWRYLFTMSNFPDTYRFAKKLLTEKANQRDILDVDLLEHKVFDNMKFYGILTWVVNSCRFEFLLVIKPNYYLNVPKLYEYLHDGVYPRKELYAGQVVTGRIKIPLERKPPSYKQRHAMRELTYVNTNGLLLSHDVVSLIIPDFKEMKSLDFKNPETIIGLICSNRSVMAWNIKNFCTSSPSRKGCQLQNSFILNRVEDRTCFQSIYEQSKNNMKQNNDLENEDITIGSSHQPDEDYWS